MDISLYGTGRASHHGRTCGLTVSWTQIPEFKFYTWLQVGATEPICNYSLQFFIFLHFLFIFQQLQFTSFSIQNGALTSARTSIRIHTIKVTTTGGRQERLLWGKVSYLKPNFATLQLWKFLHIRFPLYFNSILVDSSYLETVSKRQTLILDIADKIILFMTPDFVLPKFHFVIILHTFKYK